MITKQQAIEILKADLILRGEKYLSISTPDEVVYEENSVLAEPLNKEIRANIFLVRYRIPWVFEYEEVTVQVSAETGEVLARLGPPNYSG